LAALLACTTLQSNADPVVSVTHGNATLAANARLVTDAPKANYTFHVPAENSAAVTVGSTHYASYSSSLTGSSPITVTWYFRNGIKTESVNQGSATIAASSAVTWEKSAYLEHTENLGYGTNYQAYATSTVNDNDPNYGAGPYAGETRNVSVTYIYGP